MTLFCQTKLPLTACPFRSPSQTLAQLSLICVPLTQLSPNLAYYVSPHLTYCIRPIMMLLSTSSCLLSPAKSSAKQVGCFTHSPQDRIVFAGKAGAYPCEISFSCSTLGQAPGLTHILKSQTRLESPAKYKHSSLFGKIVNYGRNKFYDIGFRGLYRKTYHDRNLRFP